MEVNGLSGYLYGKIYITSASCHAQNSISVYIYRTNVKSKGREHFHTFGENKDFRNKTQKC
jgi:hypothetical protein